MMKRNMWGTVVVLALFLMFAGCKKKNTTLEEPIPQKPIVKEEPVIEPDPTPIDTSDDISFNEADLEAEFQRKVRENLKTVYFDYDSYTLSPYIVEQLVTAGTFLMDHSTLRVLIEGHCDERGSSEYNMGLGENRARAVKQYLSNYGIPTIRMEITSWGKERPESSGCAEDFCHEKNRRASFKVLER